MSEPEDQSEELEADLQRDSENEQYELPISAIPPKVTLVEDNQMEVSASPAFQCLDDVCNFAHIFFI